MNFDFLVAASIFLIWAFLLKARIAEGKKMVISMIVSLLACVYSIFLR
jgi:hypothetical protein